MEFIAAMPVGSNMLAAVAYSWLHPGQKDLVADGTVRYEFTSVPGISLPHVHLRGR